MSKVIPLDPKRWTFEEPKNACKALPEVPGARVRGGGEEMAHGSKSSVNRQEILEKQAWNVAIGPGKAIFMNLFMIWMMGSGSGIFAILMVGYAVMQAFSTLLNVNLAFRVFEGKINLITQKLVYVVISLAVLGYLGNHAANMGLFPINSGDWVALFHSPQVFERAVRI